MRSAAGFHKTIDPSVPAAIIASPAVSTNCSGSNCRLIMTSSRYTVDPGFCCPTPKLTCCRKPKRGTSVGCRQSGAAPGSAALAPATYTKHRRLVQRVAPTQRMNGSHQPLLGNGALLLGHKGFTNESV